MIFVQTPRPDEAPDRGVVELLSIIRKDKVSGPEGSGARLG